MTIRKNLINGAWVASEDVIENVNPSNTDEIVGVYSKADAEQANEAIAAARSAFPMWSRSTIQERSDILDAAGQAMLSRKDELARLLASEEGKTLNEAVGEVVRAGQIFKFFAAEALRLNGEILESVRPGITVNITREPVGVVGVITPWNFPIAIPAWKVAPALAFGNCVVLKPAELVPGSAWMMARLLDEAGLPPGVLNLVMGSGSDVGAAMVQSTEIEAITFTGSVNVGRQIAVEAVGSHKKIQLEMGGKNPLVITEDADLDKAVDIAVNGAFFSTGQRCTASSRLIVVRDVHDEFVNKMQNRMRKLVVDHALHQNTEIGPVAYAGQLSQNLDYLEIGSQEGVEVVGGEQVESKHKGYYMRPALFLGTDNEMRINREEIFGPIASVICAEDYEEALTIANDTQFGLCAGICTRSLEYARHFKRNSQAGMAMVNLPTAGVDYHVPFGGRKGSSYGPREQGTYAREFFTTVKTCYETG
jgi:aldehyde dehydrogenase (NAD+)